MTRFPDPGRCPVGGGFCAYPCHPLRHAPMHTGYSHNQLARQLGIHRGTLYRYRYGQQQPGRAVCISIAAMQGHGFIPGWDGWYFNAREQTLIPPGCDDYGITPGDVLVSAMTRRLIPADIDWIKAVRPARHFTACRCHGIARNDPEFVQEARSC